MLLKVRAKPGSKKPGVEKVSADLWVVRVRERAVDNKANEALVEAVREELGLPSRNVRMIGGFKSREKVLEIIE